MNQQTLTKVAHLCGCVTLLVLTSGLTAMVIGAVFAGWKEILK